MAMAEAWSVTACYTHRPRPRCTLHLDVPAEELARRRAALEIGIGYQPSTTRPRQASIALKAYAALALSADKGASRDTSRFDA